MNFNQKVYDLLLTLPRGRVITYGALAEMLGNKQLARAVGNALHNNPDGDRCVALLVRSSDLQAP